MPIRPISVTFFFSVHSLYEYVEPDQSNKRGRLEQKQTFFQCFSLFFRASVSSLLRKESMVGPRPSFEKTKRGWNT